MNSLGGGTEDRQVNRWGNSPPPVGGENRDLQDTINTPVYFSPKVVRSYPGRVLERAETVALLRFQQAVANRRVLDVGIGTGRTADFLHPLARTYVGIDYSPAMVAHVRQAMPEIEVYEADMRDLSRWPAESFDFIFATNNVLDAVSHEDRLVTLREMRRVLSQGGLFMFSSHNLNYRLARTGPRLEYSRNPVTQALHVGTYIRRCRNHARVGSLRRFESDYALLNDIGHDYGLLHYYIVREVQQRQLESVGLVLLETFDRDGRCIRDHDDDSSSPNLLYVARAGG